MSHDDTITDADKFYTLSEVAELFGVRRQTVSQWFRQGKIQKWHRKGLGVTSAILLPKEEVNRLLALAGLPAL